jgi:outer membrane protein assembly factor BamB
MRTRRRAVPRLTRLLAVGLMAGSSVTLVMTYAIPVGARAANASGHSGSWTVYHGDAAGSGASGAVGTVDTSAAAWTSPVLDGQLYGEPLVSSGDVFVATENDTVYALSTSTGRVIWSTHVGSPVPASALPCGDISPTVGITGTPVIDQSRNELFVVADELANGHPLHKLVGLSLSSGATELSENVDPPGADAAALLQRTGLTLDAHQVVFAMGGNYGDCGTYRGTVVAVRESGAAPTYFTVDGATGESQGAIWMGGAAPAVDRNGNLWVSAGNGSVHSAGQPYDDSDSALELSSSLRLVQFFAPTTWAQDNAQDEDLSTAPALLADGQVLVAGKSRVLYLLNGAHLGGIGGEEASLGSPCGGDIDGGDAVVSDVVYLPCLSGTEAVQVTTDPAALRILWSSPQGGGPPIVAAGLIWTIGQNGRLYGLNRASGAVRQQASIGAPANHFPTPSVGGGLLLAPAADRVVAFHAPSPTRTPHSGGRT